VTRNTVAQEVGQTASPVQRLVLFRALAGLGDWLCVVPALRALRVAFPQAQVELIGLPQTRAWVDRYPAYIDALIEFPGFPGLPERSPQLAQIPAFLADVQQHKVDLAIQLHGSGIITNPLTALLGAKRTAGFYLPGQYCPDAAAFLPWVESESEIRRYLRLLEFLGIPAQGEGLEFPLWQTDWQMFEAISTTHNLAPGNYVCMHPGASVAERRWSPEQFARVADALADRGLQVVLTGSASEQSLAQQVSQSMQSSAIDLTGCTSLGALAVLLHQSRLLVCNDTGVSHLAAALRVPSVVIFSQSDSNRWSPLDRDRHRVVHHPAGVTLPAVLTQVHHLLQQEPAHVA
jgi:ADP-heptose:LPS heptosyltransferase